MNQVHKFIVGADAPLADPLHRIAMGGHKFPATRRMIAPCCVRRYSPLDPWKVDTLTGLVSSIHGACLSKAHRLDRRRTYANTTNRREWLQDWSAKAFTCSRGTAERSR